MNEDEVISRVKAVYPEAVIDIAGENCSFELFIIDKGFSGMNTLQRQKSLLALFKDDITTGKLHALSIKARTPDEQKGQSGLVQLQG